MFVVAFSCLLFTELNRGHGLGHEPHMEGEEARQNHPNQGGQRPAKENQPHRQEWRITCHRRPGCFHHSPRDQMTIDRGIENKEEKVLVVPETHAIVDPRTVVVHLQDAGATDTAMMASIRFIFGTPFAMSSMT